MVEVSLRTVGHTTVVGIGGARFDADLLRRVVEGAGALDSAEPLVIDLTTAATHSPSGVRRLLEDLHGDGVGKGVAVVCERSVWAGASAVSPAWLHSTIEEALAAVTAARA